VNFTPIDRVIVGNFRVNYQAVSRFFRITVIGNIRRQNHYVRKRYIFFFVGLNPNDYRSFFNDYAHVFADFYPVADSERAHISYYQSGDQISYSRGRTKRKYHPDKQRYSLKRLRVRIRQVRKNHRGGKGVTQIF